MTEINEVHHILETTMNTLSILFNCYLLFLIKYHSTFGVKLYQYLLTIDAMLDLFLSISALIAQPVGLSGEGYTVVISNGFFAGRSAFLDSFPVFIYLIFVHTNIVWIPVQFLYRYRLLCKSDSTRANIFIVTIAVAYSAIALFFTYYAYGVVRDEFQSIGHHILDLNNWPNHKKLFVMGHHFKDWQMFSCLIFWTLTSWASIFIVVWCEKMIVKKFNRLREHSTHGSTYKMHKEFQRALLAMAICPLITTSIPVLYFMVIILLKLSPGSVSAIMTILLSSIALFNPLTTIICFRCYRQATLRLLTCGQYGKSEGSVTQTTNPSGIKSSN